MRTDSAPMLESLRVFGSQAADETAHFLEGIGFEFAVGGGRDRNPVDARLNGAYFPNLWLGYSQYGVAATVETEARADFWLQVPLRGGIEVSFGRQTFACDGRIGALTSPSRRRVLRTGDGSARLQMSLIGPAMQGQLAALIGDWPRTPLEFAPAIDLTSGYGLSLVQYLRLAIGEFEAQGHVPWNPLLISQFEQMVMTRLLLEHPHNHSEAVRRFERPVSPKGVKRAIDYMHANLEAPITLADLVAAAGVPGRTLFQQFRAFKGVPPMRYLRAQRFEQARRTLMRAAPEENVTSIAVRWGFTHMGRFAGEYRRRYGEPPSRTLAAGREIMTDPRYAQAMRAQRLGLSPSAT